MPNFNTVAILLAGGQGARAKLGYNKVLHRLGDSSVLQQSFLTLHKCVQDIVVVSTQEDLKQVQQMLKRYSPTVVVGGCSRFESVKCGLAAIVSNRIFCDIVLIHDCARCMVDVDTINSSLSSAIEHGSGIACVQSCDTVKVSKESNIILHLSRDSTYLAQTPQSFRFRDIYQAYFLAKKSNYTDDSEVYADFGLQPHISKGSFDNKKLTYPNDFAFSPKLDLPSDINVDNGLQPCVSPRSFENTKVTCSNDFAFLPKLDLPSNLKVGHGYDVHQLVKGRQLILGGVKIPFHLGLIGHSDADVLTHAIMDSLLSAAGLPDIGVHFSNLDEKYRDACSIDLLKKVNLMVQKQGFSIVNISAVLMAENPKLASYIPIMEQTLSNALNIFAEQIKVAATTTEKLGIVGNNLGMAASAVCLLAFK